ncbi:MAG: long-chain-fatty-acid--CoA ligase [Planctomycetes bacterium]|nr:long-chain-fatty-acid--CoA ligase [Planctomycetota bacterium]
MSLWRILERAADRDPEGVAVADGERRFTYREARRRAEGVTAFFLRRGVRPGDRVAILDRNSEAFFTAYFAAARCGAILAPQNHRLAPPELAAILRDASPRLLLAAEEFREKVTGVRAAGADPGEVVFIGGPDDGFEAAARADPGPSPPHATRPPDVAHLYYTSGTTGRPKGVMLTERNVAVHAEWAVRELTLSRADIWGHVAPMFHLADAWAVFAITLAGGRHAILRDFEPAAALDLIDRERITITNLIPVMLNRMLAHPRAAEIDAASLRLLLTGGSPIAPSLVRRTVTTFRCGYAQTYGMTETSPYLTVSLLDARQREFPDEERLRLIARTGRPFGGVELRVVDEAGHEVPRDDLTVGEIEVRGPTVTPGYWNRPEETAAAFREGWLRTGDLARVDGEGFVEIVDRKKDMILTGGENVFSIEVENVLYRHPGILEAAVAAAPDPVWGEVVRAFVVPRAGTVLDAEELRSFCRESLAGYKVPRIVTFLDALPRTGSGKISKRALRGMPVEG